jgi:hypothetical protein
MRNADLEFYHFMNISEFYISEPWTFVTDILLAIFSFYFSLKIYQDPRKNYSTAYKLWVGIFIAIGASALQGALYHGFAHALPKEIFSALRIGTLWGLNATALLLSLSILYFACPRNHPLFKILFGLIFLKSIFFVVWSAVQVEFVLAITLLLYPASHLSISG